MSLSLGVPTDFSALENPACLNYSFLDSRKWGIRNGDVNLPRVNSWTLCSPYAGFEHALADCRKL